MGPWAPRGEGQEDHDAGLKAFRKRGDVGKGRDTSPKGLKDCDDIGKIRPPVLPPLPGGFVGVGVPILVRYRLRAAPIWNRVSEPVRNDTGALEGT